MADRNDWSIILDLVSKLFNTCFLAIIVIIVNFLPLFREGRDENSIRKPKASLYGLRRAVEYFVSKLRNLHIKEGLNYVKNEKDPVKRGEWFRGYHCFESKKVVHDRFERGQALSCFVLNNNYGEVHVAYRTNASCRGGDDLYFATFHCSTLTLPVQESGVHFCKFTCSKELTTAKKQDLNITDYALMLPYIQTRKDRVFQKQFTLIYSDWEVLRCDLESKKGLVSINNNNFNDI